MTNFEKQLQAYLNGQRTTGRATAAKGQGQEVGVVPTAEDTPQTTPERVAAAIVEQAQARDKTVAGWSNITIMELPKSSEAARAAMSAILANAKGGKKLWVDG
jgi:hypothetical protein